MVLEVSRGVFKGPCVASHKARASLIHHILIFKKYRVRLKYNKANLFMNSLPNIYSLSLISQYYGLIKCRYLPIDFTYQYKYDICLLYIL